MSLLNTIAKMNKASNVEVRTPMTDRQFEQCKNALRRDNRGFNVSPNKFDIKTPYRVSVNFEDKWSNFGNFKCVHTAAAIGSVVSAAFFGARGVAGEFDPEVVGKSTEFVKWIQDPRNQDVIDRAEGKKPSFLDEKNGVIALESDEWCDPAAEEVAEEEEVIAEEEDDSDCPF